jgi:radical SAM protein with 4Fe4S-binding SPASM domain
MIGLVHVDVNLTNACNLACAHCHSASGKALPNELTTAELLDVVGQLHDMGGVSITFAGGEPFMRPDIVDILSAACRRDGWSVGVVTNGLFMTGAMVEQLASRCPGLVVNVSMDGSSPHTFSLLRAQPGASHAARDALFRRVVSGIRRAVGAGMTVSVNTTITRTTAHDLRSTYTYAVDELGARSVVAIKFFPAGYGLQHLQDFDFPWAEWKMYFAELTRSKLAGDLPAMQLSVPSPWEFYLPLIDASIDLPAAEEAWHYRSALREPRYRRMRSVGDVAGTAELCLDGDGTVYPSILMVGDRRVSCGNVRSQPVAELWTESPVLQQIRGLELADLHGGCRDCPMAALCGGGSRARALVDSGAVDGADAWCPIVQVAPQHEWTAA